MSLIKNQLIKVGGSNSAAGKQAADWNDENIQVDGGAYAITNA
ncbi:MAG TPA: hypothetical protein VNN22_06525 [Verrucomicrobiae bacterium]|nr:hypothetical protein [Verrucomicrobiae bacterium]